MARLPRFVLPGHPQHIIVRGNNRESIFYTDEDYRFYLDKLQQASLKHQCDVHAYVLMTNHVHILITPHQEKSISKAMQMLGRYYVQYFNYSWALGSDRFKERMAPKLSRPVKPSLRGGDRKSKAYHENRIINRDRLY